MVCLLLCTMHIPAFGAEKDSKDLEQAIVSAKQIITVPDSYTDFTNYSNERETISGKVLVWRLNWSEKEDKNGSISATIGENGVLYEYRKYNDDMSQKGLAQVTKEKAQITAEEFLKRVMPTDAGQMKIVDKNFNSYSNEEYYLTYQKYVNEVAVNFINVNIGVNKYSGEVTSFNGENTEIKGLEYPTLDGVMESALAEKAYIEKLGVALKYYSYYDYKQKKMNIFTGYSIGDNENNAIDAKTGQVISIDKSDNSYMDNMNGKSGNGMETSLVTAKQDLTKEETDAIKNVSNLITKEKAESILRETFDIITSDMKVKSISLNKKHNNENYVWNISFEGAYGEIDAQSGEVLSFNSYKNNKETKDAVNKNILKSEAQNIAEDFLEKNSPNKFAQTKYQEVKNRDLKISTIEEEKISSFNYVRQVNGIEFSNNRLRVEVDKTNGKVIGYNNNWYENVEFPDISKVITKEDAFNKIKGLSGFELQYALLDKNKVGLVYNFNNINENYIIEPLNGIRIDFTGKVYKENKLPEYTDIAGQGCENTVKELLNNGYYIDGDKFNPNMSITQINFFKYLYSPVKSGYNSDDKFYDMLIENGVIKKEEKSPNSFVSNEDAAKFVIRYLGYERIAVHPEIFINPFKDNVEEKYKGYAAMCYSLDIIKGVDGKFYGNNNISNAEAATILYNLITVANQS